MLRRALLPLLGLALLLAAPGLAAATGTPVPAATRVDPAQPIQPATGPGSDDALFPAARAVKHGPDPGGFWLWEPATGTAAATPVAAGPFPVVLYLSGCCGNGDWPTPEEVDPWLTHLARQGYVVIAPVYRFGTPVEDSKARLREALAELEQPGHAGIDLARFVVIGFSYGGMTAVLYTASAEAEGLPVPRALFLTAPCTANGFCLDMPAAMPVLPAGLMAVVLAFDDDFVIGDEPKLVFQTLVSLPEEDRDFVLMSSDLHGEPQVLAEHDTTYDGVDSADWYGVWKLSDALFACALRGEWCAYALGNTPEQRSMGIWSDGQAVKELQVTDNPSDLEP